MKSLVCLFHGIAQQPWEAAGLGLSVPSCCYGHCTGSDTTHSQSPALTVRARLRPWPPLGLGLHLGPIVAYNMSEWREFVAIIKTKKWHITANQNSLFTILKSALISVNIQFCAVLSQA